MSCSESAIRGGTWSCCCHLPCFCELNAYNHTGIDTVWKFLWFKYPDCFKMYYIKYKILILYLQTTFDKISICIYKHKHKTILDWKILNINFYTSSLLSWISTFSPCSWVLQIFFYWVSECQLGEETWKMHVILHFSYYCD